MVLVRPKFYQQCRSYMFTIDELSLTTYFYELLTYTVNSEESNSHSLT